MEKRRIYFRGVFLLSLMSVVFAAVTLFPPQVVAEDFGDTSGESPHATVEKEDPHARFRDGSMGGMMEMMRARSPHSKSSKKSVHPPFSAQGLKESLDLDDAQAKKVRDLLSKYRKGVILKKANLRVAQIELDESVADRNFVLSDVEKKAMGRESAATALTMVRVNALVEAREVLSKEQFSKFMRMLTHQMSSHGRKGKKGHHGRQKSSFFSGHGETRGRHHDRSPHGDVTGRGEEGY